MAGAPVGMWRAKALRAKHMKVRIAFDERTAAGVRSKLVSA